MCSHIQLSWDSVESSVEDLIECFEDFVKKSLLLISVAVGAIVVLVMYLLGVATARTHTSRSRASIRSSRAAVRQRLPVNKVVNKSTVTKKASREANGEESKANNPTQNVIMAATPSKQIGNDLIMLCNYKPDCKSANTVPIAVAMKQTSQSVPRVEDPKDV